MQRFLRNALDRWKLRPDRKPLILRGVRQCGKTWLLKEWGRENYTDVAYFNFESSPALGERFAADLDPRRLLTELGVYHGRRLDPLTTLKYFQEQAPEIAIACAGSLLGISLAGPSSFPVGKVEFLTLHPLSFEVFVVANEQGMLLEYLMGLVPGSTVPSLFADQLVGMLKIYYLTGGMPEVVARLVQNRDMEDALQWLVGSGMVHKVCRVEKPGIPLSAHSQPKSFKLYLADCGLLRRLARVPESAIMDDSPHYTEFKGALVENYVLNQLVTFWRIFLIGSRATPPRSIS
jgi:predicted AAA+ superfamily ATPase